MSYNLTRDIQAYILTIYFLSGLVLFIGVLVRTDKPKLSHPEWVGLCLMCGPLAWIFGILSLIFKNLATNIVKLIKWLEED